MDIIVLSSGMPRIFETPSDILFKQLSLERFSHTYFFGLYWSAITDLDLVVLRKHIENVEIVIEKTIHTSIIGFENKASETRVNNFLSMLLARKLLLNKFLENVKFDYRC